jgi:hypothetical protein
MLWSDLPSRPTERLLRQFAGLWLVVFGALAADQWLRHDRATLAIVLAVAAVVVGVAGLIAPRLVRPIFVGWMAVAFPIGWTISNALLAVLYYGLFTPLGGLLRVAGRDPLRRKRPADESYWQPKPMPADVTSYFQQS